MERLIVACAAVLSCLAFAPASVGAAPAQQPPHYTAPAQRPPHYTVSLNTVFGSGCPTGSTTVRQSDKTHFTVLYSRYQAATGGGTGLIHENCELTVNVGVPSGWTYGISEVDYSGFANLDAGAHGMLAADYYFSGEPTVFPTQHSVYGPYSNNYAFADYVPVQSIGWAPCGFNGTLNIDTSATVYAGSNPAFHELLRVNRFTLPHLSFETC